MSKMKKFFGGFGRLILAMTVRDSFEDPFTKIKRTVRWWGKSFRVLPTHWYDIERNKYAPWGRGRLGGRQIEKSRVLPANREFVNPRRV